MKMKIAKRIIVTIYFGLMITLGIKYSLPTQKITILEISIVENYDALWYRVSYIEDSLVRKIVSHIDFKTTLGVENYLNEVADYDLSQWRAVKHDTK